MGNQVTPAIAVNATDNFVVVWAGPEAGQTPVDQAPIDIYARVIDPPSASATASQTFAVSGPTSGTYQAGQTVSIPWTAGNVVSGSKISLCYDVDATFNGNEHWIEIDGVTASNSGGTYSWNTAGVAAGTYYLAGYMYDGSKTFTFSHLTQAITITGTAAQTFAVTAPTSGSYAAGSSVGIQWTAGGVVSGSKISLCYDTDTTFNGNEHWIEIDGVTAANGSGTYTWNTTGVAAGTYYLAGYMYDGSKTFKMSHLTGAITITGGQAVAAGSQTFAVTAPTSGTYQAGQAVTVQWTAGGVVSGSKISLCYDTDTTFNGNEHWIEIDGVTANNGAGTYTWHTAGVAAGTYYLGGYMYDGSKTFKMSHLTGAITIQGAVQTFALASAASSTYQVGQAIGIQWTAGGVVSGSKISLCYDTDTTFNGNEHWIEIDAVTAANGAGTFTWNTTGVAPGTYYLAGYMYDGHGTFTMSHLTQAITLTGLSNSSSTKSLALGPVKSDAINAVFANLGRSTIGPLTDSAKADWLYDI